MFMSRLFILIVCLFGFLSDINARSVVVVDSVSRKPLPNASVFDRYGKFIGICSSKGTLPYVSASEYPVTIRYIGYKERNASIDADTVFMQENVMDLPEVVVESRQHRLLHILGYVREYSTLTTYTDTIFLFREKMVDFMLPTQRKMRFKGWMSPRVLTSRSYYRFTNNMGIDSVSNRCSHHFSWADWIGLIPTAALPVSLVNVDNGTDTVMGKYSPTEVWVKKGDRVTLDVNVLADTTSRKWVPNISSFFREGLDFEQFRVRFNFDNPMGGTFLPIDITGYSFNIESNGRGRDMFMFNRINQPFFVSTYGEVYIVDKEYITLKEAKKWERNSKELESIEIFEPASAPELQSAILLLVDRVNNVDHDQARLSIEPDKRLARRGVVKMNFGQQALQRIKGIFGIDVLVGRRKMNRQWKDFKQEWIRQNQEMINEADSLKTND